MRAKRRALMAQRIACCSWSAYGRRAPKRWGGPAVADAVSSVDYPPVAAPGRAVETGKKTIRHQKGKGRAKTGIRPLTACESVKNPSCMGRGGVFSASRWGFCCQVWKLLTVRYRPFLRCVIDGAERVLPFGAKKKALHLAGRAGSFAALLALP